jgi:hypothetical protein
VPLRQGKHAEFLAVDLDIKSRRALSSLVAAFGNQVSATEVEKRRGRHWVHLCLLRDMPEPGAAIRRYVRIIERLPPAARRLLKECVLVFDIGIKSSRDTRSCAEWELSANDVALIEKLGGTVRMTVYGPLD